MSDVVFVAMVLLSVLVCAGLMGAFLQQRVILDMMERLREDREFRNRAGKR